MRDLVEEWLPIAFLLAVLVFAVFKAFYSPDYTAAVVIIEDDEGHGSGIFISPNKVLTAGHVAKDLKDNERVRGPDGSVHHVTNTAILDAADIAVLTVDHPYTGAVPQISCRAPKRGEIVNYYGNPVGLEFIGPVPLTVIGGRPPNDDDTPEGLTLVDGAIIGGASGSGVIDSQGNLIGSVDLMFGRYPFAPSGFAGYVGLSNPNVCKFVMEHQN